MDPRISGIRASLHGCEDVREQWRLIEEWAAAGRTDPLYELATALEADSWASGTERWAVEAVVDQVEKSLALTPGLSSAETLLRLSLLKRQSTIQFPSEPGRTSQMRLRYFASLLASAQSREVLAEVFERHSAEEGYAEVLSLLVHEMVLRGIPCAEVPPIADYYASMRAAHDPLAWLPLSLTDLETEIRLPRYFLRGGSCALPFGPTKGDPAETVRRCKEAIPGICDSTTEAHRCKIRSAVAEWEKRSNGRSEARVFDLAHGVAETGLSSIPLTALGLECLRGAGEGDIHVRPTSVSHAFAILFAAASDGGAYRSEQWGAYGRYAAWGSMAGLVGAPEDQNVEQLSTRAIQSEWLFFDAKTDWFHQVAWDFGLIALRPDGMSLAVLAATDTD